MCIVQGIEFESGESKILKTSKILLLWKKLKEAHTVFILSIVCDSIKKAIKEALKNWRISFKAITDGFHKRLLFKKLVFLIEGWVLHRIMLFPVKPQPEPAIGTLSSWALSFKSE